MENKISKFLTTLKTESEKEHVEFLYYYAKNLVEYYSTCHVVNRNIIIIDFDIQMTDIGDEIYNTVYNVEKNIYGIRPEGSFAMKIYGCSDFKDNGMCDYTPSKMSPSHRGFITTGSNENRLNIHWVITVDNIKE